MGNANMTTFEPPSSAMKSPCATCSKPIGIVRCEGCQKLFCHADLNDHRSELFNQLDALSNEHNVFQQTLKQTETDLRTHALIQRIDIWEKESKQKIREVAKEARQKVLMHATANTKEILTRFKEMVDNLQQAQKENIFDERDLNQWTEQLKQLKENFVSPSSITVEEEPGTFIAKMQVRDLEMLSKRFQHVCGYGQIQNDGLSVICTNIFNQVTSVRGKGEHSNGLHKVQFKIENYSNRFLFFGIISKSTPLRYNSYCSASSYGWAAGANNAVYMNGQRLNNYEGYISYYAVNDTIELEMDCYRRLIRLRNNRTNKHHKLPIDLDKCPFPWIFHVNLGSNGDRLRIVLEANPQDN